MKPERKAKENAEKEKDKPAQEVAKVKAKDGIKKEESLVVQKMNKMEGNPYPPKFQVNISLQNFVKKFDHLSVGESVIFEVNSIAGKGRKA